mmetsp:Transcript_33791/g.43189  ORF Transcript_33791/g.43189 Transcript_33791/m.43189 type:complete len:208 (-) Transcript_33791:1583-2206(-)
MTVLSPSADRGAITMETAHSQTLALVRRAGLDLTAENRFARRTVTMGVTVLPRILVVAICGRVHLWIPRRFQCLFLSDQMEVRSLLGGLVLTARLPSVCKQKNSSSTYTIVLLMGGFYLEATALMELWSAIQYVVPNMTCNIPAMMDCLFSLAVGMIHWTRDAVLKGQMMRAAPFTHAMSAAVATDMGTNITSLVQMVGLALQNTRG